MDEWNATYLSLKSLVELLLVVGRDVLGVQLPQTIPYPAVLKQQQNQKNDVLLR
jgi:hypothetical protein